MNRKEARTAWVGLIAPIFSSQRQDLGGVTSFEQRETTRTAFRDKRRLRAPVATANSTFGSSGKAEMPEKWCGGDIQADALISKVKFNDAGLVPAIAQQWDTGEVLMMAWMSAESIRETMQGGRAVYYSRSRKELWRKGDTSGQIQVLRDILLDCDGDTILVKVDQLGVACHTGRRSCFYTAFRPPFGEPQIIADVIMDPRELYKTRDK